MSSKQINRPMSGTPERTKLAASARCAAAVAAVAASLVAPSAWASLTNCGSLASDYQGSNDFNDETRRSNASDNVFRYRFVPTSGQGGNVRVFIGGNETSAITGIYSVVPNRTLNEALVGAHGMIAIAFTSTFPGFCNQEATGLSSCTVRIVGAPVCGTLGSVRLITGTRTIDVLEDEQPAKIYAMGPIVLGR